MLAPDLLDLLRQWCRVKRPRGWAPRLCARGAFSVGAAQDCGTD